MKYDTNPSFEHSQNQGNKLEKWRDRAIRLVIGATALGLFGAWIHDQENNKEYQTWYVTGNMPDGLDVGNIIEYIPGSHGGVDNPIVRRDEGGNLMLVGFNATESGEDEQGERYLFDADISSSEIAPLLDGKRVAINIGDGDEWASTGYMEWIKAIDESSGEELHIGRGLGENE